MQVVFLAVTLLALRVAAISDTSDTPGHCCELHRTPCCRSCYTPIPGTLCYCDQPCNSDYGKCCPDDRYVCLNEASEQSNEAFPGLVFANVDFSRRPHYHEFNATLPPTSTLQYVYAIFRHGIRSPIREPYPKSPNARLYKNVFPGVRGKLTKAGIRQMYNVGKDLRARYGDFVGDYSQEKVHVTASNVSTRTVVSSISVMAGMFPPAAPILNNLPTWQPIPVWENSTIFDKVYVYDAPSVATHTCPKIAAITAAALNVSEQPDQRKDRQLIYKLMRENTGHPEMDSVMSVGNVYDVILFEGLNGLPQPEWAIGPRPELDNKPLFPDLLEPIYLEFYYNNVYLEHKQSCLQFISGPLLYSIQEQLKKHEVPGEEKFRFHGTSDFAIMGVLSGIGVDVRAIIDPGDGVLFEVHRENLVPEVKVLYYHSMSHSLERLILGRCPDPCTVDEFIKKFPGLSPERWTELCFSDDPCPPAEDFEKTNLYAF
ncbi:prostatic acid phosphatase-like isoform X1 [Homalodisca vitripennis]|uniref:prostatic acid phosphatase-like isoform X1 n=1 Tax=Homalodisca vitripennis TaxID=197043 RepID=UPI001EECEC54|nr:prostatic acid phosphatase-like isoform X1 [Homalodisca vitripennis]